jgi:CubicO group peptidase (beta-lactamase class C family)
MKKGFRTTWNVLILTIVFLNTSYIIPCTYAEIVKPFPQTIPIDIPTINHQNTESFDLKISVLMTLARFPSLSACIIADNTVIWENGYGYYDLEQKKQPDQHTIYYLASITKTIVGTALMQLFEQGLFDLDDDVNSYLPFELRNPYFSDDTITFRMLLSHTSSLNTNNRNEYYWLNFTGDPPFRFFPEPYLKEFLLPEGKFYHENVWSNRYRPGETAMYANVGFDLISYLVELISGLPFLEYCQQYIFDPLEMRNTSFNLSQLPLDQVAVPYQYFFGTYYQINQLPAIFGAIPESKYWRTRFYPAGGLYTSINDLSHFLIAHMNQGRYKDFQLLTEDTVDLMQTIHPDNQLGYGLAWMEYPLTRTVKGTGHGGDIMGVDTWMLYNKTEDIGVIFFANGNPYYGSMPTVGGIATQLILSLLFTKYQNN